MNCETIAKAAEAIRCSSSGVTFPIVFPQEFLDFTEKVKASFSDFVSSIPDGEYGKSYFSHRRSDLSDFLIWREIAIIGYVEKKVSYKLHAALMEIFSSILYDCRIAEIKELHDVTSVNLMILVAYRGYCRNSRAIISPIYRAIPENKKFDRPVIKFDDDFNIVHGDNFTKWAYKDEFSKYVANCMSN